MKKLLIATALIAASSVQQVYAWGQTGHRITGAIAEQYLSDDARAAIRALLPNESLAEASTYADEMRSNPSDFWQKEAGPYHYVSVPVGESYKEHKHAPEEGDAFTALNKFTKIVKDGKAPLEERQRALRFIIHIIGDLHQPLHAGNGTDRGGNDVKLEFFWDDSNLHRVWDSGLLDRRQLSYSEWTEWLSEKITPEQAKAWSITDPHVYIMESAAIRDTIYPESDRLSWDYLYQHLPTATQRLQEGGVRIAAHLNEMFAK
ncbi:S1/P1 nuclease [Glaciecola sp. MH2013]|uniref:S1/P1 nuclease n=1 Tax=Glaciecola sp. MH2013 TaxID=2785524 RepID=UPI00189D8546|nr:S1/P1 nuclease [Glaciecola sp. MH2013]MBF7073651.1 S1/P1 nuclease [Glaciecola sp. MH2013]